MGAGIIRRKADNLGFGRKVREQFRGNVLVDANSYHIGQCCRRRLCGAILEGSAARIGPFARSND